MAKQEVGLKIDVDVKSVGNMKQELRAATQELIAVNEKFGSTSTQAVAAAKRVASLKDAIGDAKALADTFNPDKKFVALGGAVQGAVAGFSALQGAIGLFGSESKEVEKVLLKVQSAMALQQGISGIAGAMDSFKLLSGVIKTQVVAAFTTLRGAMMATGIGLITSAVAFLVTNFDSVKKTLGELFPVLKGTGDLMDRLKQIAMGVGNAILQFLAAPVSALIKIFQGDFKGAIDAVKNGFAFVKNFREGEKKEIESQAADAEAARQAELEKQKKANEKKLEEQKRAAEERLKNLKEQQEKEKQLREAADKVEEEARRSLLTQRQRDEEDALKTFEQGKLILQQAGVTNFLNIELQYQEALKAIRIKYETEEKERLQKEQDEKLKNDKERQDADIQNKQNQFDKIRQTTLDYNTELVRAEEQLQNAKFEAASAGLNAIATLAQGNEKIANIFFAIDKALAIGKIIVDAQKEISSNMSYGAAHPMNLVVPGSGAALGAKLSLVTKIRAAASIASIAAATIAKFKSGGGGAAGIGGGGISTAAPVAPALAPQVMATQVNTAAVNQMGNRAARAYVLNSDIQNEQQRNAYIDRNASIGTP